MKRWVLVLLCAFVAAWLFYYPPFFTFSDEGQYLHATWLLSDGKSPRVTDPADSFAFQTKDHQVFFPQYAIGQSVLLLPFAVIDWRAVFLLGLMLHLVSFFLLARLLREHGVDASYASLYLLYPGIVFFSRTLMSELASSTLILLGFYFYLRDKDYSGCWSGFFFGCALLIRYTNVFFVAPFFLAALIINRRKFYHMTMFAAPFALFVLFYNHAIYGGLFSSGIKSPRGFSLLLFAKYLASLLVVYPLLVCAPFFTKSKARWEILASFSLALAIFSYSGIDTFHYDVLKNLVIGYRYVFPLMPVLLFTYCVWLSGMKKTVARFLPFVCVAILAADIVIMEQQYSFTSRNGHIMEKIYDITAPDSFIVGNGYVTSMFVNRFFGNRSAFSVHTFVSKSENVPGAAFTTIIQREQELLRQVLVPGSYFVFAESGIISGSIKVAEAPAEEITDEREGNLLVAQQFNATLIFEENEPDYIQVWKTA